uniref:Manganese/iron superoxide dismutase C-terminal domain-containing protein n=1 Tax=Strombidium rassoulzadegani TaxID=1082188 RepID=A0A7S3FX50_9SPIT|mmetsp:Transcript_2971/g.5022  ORF Transcript_2971/g.5022 Transcript_2971/m.5022 type:complete len:194 (+) Transcript_2971:90-671(+)
MAKHITHVLKRMKEQVALISNEDEDMQKQTLTEAQECAGFEEMHNRIVIGGYFNHLFFFSILGAQGGASEPQGQLKEMIDKHFTDYSGFKESFKKVVAQRFQPGWVWLSILPDGSKLLVTQTNNEDNTLMMGVIETKSIPIICLDLWEHSYWEEHEGSANGSYVEQFFDNVDWQKVSKNFEDYNVKGQVAPLL